MNIYGILLLAACVVFFIYATGMTEPFGFIGHQFQSILADIRQDNILFNSVVLALVIALFAGAIRRLFKKREPEPPEHSHTQMMMNQFPPRSNENHNQQG